MAEFALSEVGFECLVTVLAVEELDMKYAIVPLFGGLLSLLPTSRTCDHASPLPTLLCLRQYLLSLPRELQH